MRHGSLLRIHEFLYLARALVGVEHLLPKFALFIGDLRSLFGHKTLLLKSVRVLLSLLLDLEALSF
jgi:hypothetical protein|tara:strand:- start:278 stop:475 length:198 start_codon:yes stop_codon:yes gene_type:complete